MNINSFKILEKPANFIAVNFINYPRTVITD